MQNLFTRQERWESTTTTTKDIDSVIDSLNIKLRDYKFESPRPLAPDTSALIGKPVDTIPTKTLEIATQSTPVNLKITPKKRTHDSVIKEIEKSFKRPVGRPKKTGAVTSLSTLNQNSQKEVSTIKKKPIDVDNIENMIVCFGEDQREKDHPTGLLDLQRVEKKNPICESCKREMEGTELPHVTWTVSFIMINPPKKDVSSSVFVCCSWHCLVEEVIREWKEVWKSCLDGNYEDEHVTIMVVKDKIVHKTVSKLSSLIKYLENANKRQSTSGKLVPMHLN
jgi:hypothetical protein